MKRLALVIMPFVFIPSVLSDCCESDNREASSFYAQNDRPIKIDRSTSAEDHLSEVYELVEIDSRTKEKRREQAAKALNESGNDSDKLFFPMAFLICIFVAVAAWLFFAQKGCPNCGFKWNRFQRLDFASDEDKRRFYQDERGSLISLNIKCKKCRAVYVQDYPIRALTGYPHH